MKLLRQQTKLAPSLISWTLEYCKENTLYGYSPLKKNQGHLFPHILENSSLLFVEGVEVPVHGKEGNSWKSLLFLNNPDESYIFQYEDGQEQPFKPGEVITFNIEISHQVINSKGTKESWFALSSTPMSTDVSIKRCAVINRIRVSTFISRKLHSGEIRK